MYCERAKVSHIYPNHGSSVEPHLCQSWQFGWKEMPSHSCGFVCLPQLRSFRPVRADVRALGLMLSKALSMFTSGGYVLQDFLLLLEEHILGGELFSKSEHFSFMQF